MTVNHWVASSSLARGAILDVQAYSGLYPKCGGTSTAKLYSETNPEALKELKPNFGLRSLSEISIIEKNVMWLHLKDIFIDEEFLDLGLINAGDLVDAAVSVFNKKYQFHCYAPNFLRNPSYITAIYDFEEIFKNQKHNVVLELLSIFYQILKDIANKSCRAYELFSSSIRGLNDTLQQFGVNITLTPQGFIPRQDEKITEEVYIPVLKCLSQEKWLPINRELKDAFADYQSPDYSGCITHTISAIQAFLQILVYGEIGKGELGNLLAEAQKKKIIPTDRFSQALLPTLQSTFAQVRQEEGDAHPTVKDATDKNALFILNLAMVFFQHCLSYTTQESK